MPIRTCLVTGQKKEQSELKRFTFQNGEIIFDTEKKNIGRGGYVIPTEENKAKIPKLQKKMEHFLNPKKNKKK